MQALIFAAFIVLAIGMVILTFYLSAKRRKALAAWAQSKGLSFTAANDHGLEDRYSEFHCLQQGSNRYAHNLCQGDWAGQPIIACDYHYETYSHGSKGGRQTHHHRFSAVILRSKAPLKPLFIRPEHFFDKVTEFFGYDDIDFESAEFSRKFYVKAEDRKWAYDVIHARTMQFLLERSRFTIQFGLLNVIAYRSSTFKPAQFEQAIDVVQGILDRLPDYLVKELTEPA